MPTQSQKGSSAPVLRGSTYRVTQSAVYLWFIGRVLSFHSAILLGRMWLILKGSVTKAKCSVGGPGSMTQWVLPGWKVREDLRGGCMLHSSWPSLSSQGSYILHPRARTNPVLSGKHGWTLDSFSLCQYCSSAVQLKQFSSFDTQSRTTVNYEFYIALLVQP